MSLECSPTKRRCRSARLQHIHPVTDTWWRVPKGRLAPVPTKRVGLHELRNSWGQFLPAERKLTNEELKRSVDRLHNTGNHCVQTSAITGFQKPLRPMSAIDGRQERGWRVGPIIYTPVFIDKTKKQEMISRLSARKDEKKVGKMKSVKLTYKFDAGGNGGLGCYHEEWVGVKKISEGENVQALAEFSKTCNAKASATKEALAQKYMQPLVSPRKIKQEEWEQHMEKIERLHKGQGVVDK